MSNCDNKSIQKRIRVEAQELSKLYGLSIIESSLVLNKIAKLNWCDPDYAIYSEMEKAFKYMSPQDALELFNKEDLTQLATRVLLVEYLNNRAIPLHTIDKLAQLSKEFIIHLEKNKEHLLQTGFPKSTFEKSPWLNKHLNRLYYYKLPIFEQYFLNYYANNPAKALSWQDNPFASKITRDCGIEGNERLNDILKLNWMLTNEEKFKVRHVYKYKLMFGYDLNDELIFHYKWAKSTRVFEFEGSTPYDSGLFKNNDYYEILRLTHEDISEAITANYEEASIIKGFSEADVSIIVRLREKLFNLKISVLERLIEATISKSNKSLISDCINIISDYLSPEEIRFLISKDHFYSNIFSGKEGMLNGTNLIYHNAGLSDLFKVIGHFYKEIELSTMDEISKGANESLERGLPSSYYEAIGKSWQKDLDILLYYFAILEERELEFWNKYKLYINEMLNLGTQFSQEYGTTAIDNKSVGFNELLTIKVSDNKELITDRETFEVILKEFMNRGGEFVFKLPPSENLSSQKDEFVFADMGRVWKIVYKGNKIFMDDIIGLHYIKILLSKPKELFNPVELVSLIEKILPNKTPYSSMSYDQLAGESLYKSHASSDNVASRKAKQKTLERIHELEKDRDEAISNNQYDLAVKYDEELEQLENSVQEEYGQSYKRKIPKKDYKRMYDLTYASIKRAIQKITELDPELGKHLDQSIGTGIDTSYCPQDEVPWILEAKL